MVCEAKPEWTIFSSHGIVLLYIAAQPDATLRVLSDSLGLTERQISRILKDLISAGMVEVERVGRRNVYQVNTAACLRHPEYAHIRVESLVQAIVPQLVTDTRSSNRR